MLRNYLTVAIRNLSKSRFHSALSVFCLSVGMACAWLGGLYVWDQYQFDRYHAKGDRIYKVIRHVADASGTRFDPGTHPVGPVIKERIPEVEEAVRILPRDMWVAHEEKGFMSRVCLIDPGFLNVFDYPLERGGGGEGLRQAGAAYITRSLASRLFGLEDPIGKVVKIDYKWVKGDFQVTGVLKDPPRRSSSNFHFDLVTATYPEVGWKRLVWDEWPNRFFVYPLRTYVLLREGVSPRAVEAKLQSLAEMHNAVETNHKVTYRLQPLRRVHLYSARDYGILDTGGATLVSEQAGDIEKCRTIALVGLLVLVIACFNYVNLATARASNRAREVGLRKIVGATRRQLVAQCLGESLVLVVLSACIAAALTRMALPFFNDVAASRLTLVEQGPGVIGWGLVATVIFVGLAAGGYPALVLSGFAPARALTAERSVGSGRAWFRTSLVVVQFGVSSVLLIATLVVYQQMAFVRSVDVGFERRHVLLMPVFHRDTDLYQQAQAVRQAFAAAPGVVHATAVLQPPGRGGDVDSHLMTADGKGEEKFKVFYKSASENFLETFEIELVEGEKLDGKQPGPSGDRYQIPALVNQTAVRTFGWDQPIGRTFRLPDQTTRVRSREGEVRVMVSEFVVAGVMKDFYDRPLYYETAPVMVRLGGGPYVAVRIRPDHVPQTLDAVAAVWRQFLPSHPFEYEFLDDVLDQFYRNEMNLRDVYATFAGLSILIACLGVLGLISYTAQQRTKEIGIRKTIGATAGSVVMLLSRDFLKLSLVASAIAIPVGYFAVRSWLETFAYRIAVNPLVYAGSALLLLAAVFATVSGVALRAARVDPVVALRHE